MGAATKLLANTLKKLMNEPVEGFTVELEDDANLFEWTVWIEGPKDTCYEGGVFQLHLKFPPDFPMSPPELKFISDFWHPNVYKDTGVVCISILHPPGVDELSGELPGERWLPTQTVTTIILSVISLLNAPNFSSPANVDASVEWRKDPDQFRQKCQRLVAQANKSKPSRIVIPHPDTNPEEREKQVQKMREMNKPIDMDDFMHDDNVPQEQDSEGESSEIQSDFEDKSESSEDKDKNNAKGKRSSKQSKASKSKGKKSNSNKEKTTKSKTKASKEEDLNEDSETTQSQEQSVKRRKKKKCVIM